MVRTEHITHHPLATLTDEARKLRQHALERLTIFLAEARRKQSEYSVEWLKKEGNFVVKEVKDLKAKHTLRQGKQEYAHYEVSPFLLLVEIADDRLYMRLLPSSRIRRSCSSSRLPQNLMIGSESFSLHRGEVTDEQYCLLTVQCPTQGPQSRRRPPAQ